MKQELLAVSARISLSFAAILSAVLFAVSAGLCLSAVAAGLGCGAVAACLSAISALSSLFGSFLVGTTVAGTNTCKKECCAYNQQQAPK